jgi:aspartyl-tRNA synthetase
MAEDLRSEYVIYVEGEVRARPDGMVNQNLATGSIDVYANKLTILNSSKTPAIAVNDASEEAQESEEVRLKYRYLDLRRPREQKLIRQKSQFLYAWRSALHKKGFDEIETPILCKSTPEGARDFLVPSRLNQGQFYALPQSPQTYKQLLMISGFEKYYQIAKCFRDEDLRADRQPEFLQIDCEMSFVDCEDVYAEFEQAIAEVTQAVWNYTPTLPFRRMPYQEAMLKYGSDKPDLRYNMEIADVSDVAKDCGFKVFRDAVEAGGVVRGIAATGCMDFTRKIIDELTEFVGRYGSKGLVWMRNKEDGIETQVAKFFQDGELETLRDRIGGQSGDMLFFVAGPEKMAATALGHLRTEVARLKNMAEGKPHEFLWVTDFPMFEYSETEKRYTAMHHPFTAPQDDQVALMEKGELENIAAKAYDLVLNGVEIGGGSIRIHDAKMQDLAFKCLGLTPEQVKQKFGYFVEAFEYGAPPHGGLAFGVDRFLATMENRASIRDYIPFPKTSSGTSLMEDSPSEVELEQLRELHIRLKQ